LPFLNTAVMFTISNPKMIFSVLRDGELDLLQAIFCPQCTVNWSWLGLLGLRLRLVLKWSGLWLGLW